MRVVIGIDVSKSKLNYAIISEFGEILGEDKTLNDLSGLETVLSLQREYNAEIIFEATGVYSRRMQFFFELNDVKYVKMNPLKAKKEMDTLRITKNDSIDAKGLAQLKLDRNYKNTLPEKEIYTELRNRHRFYQEIVQDSVRAKNRLKKVLQDTFSEIENLFAGDNLSFYEIVKVFPHADLVKNKTVDEVSELLNDIDSIKIIKIHSRAEKLVELANKTAVSVNADSNLIQQVIYWADQVLNFNNMKIEIIDGMVEYASDLPEVEIIKSIPGFGNASAVALIAEMGDIRRFSTHQKMNAFIGIDLRFYDSGKKTTSGYITKRGNYLARKIMYQNVNNMLSAASKSESSSNYVTDWYFRRKKLSNDGKKLAIGAMDRTFRLIHHLVLSNEMYSSN